MKSNYFNGVTSNSVIYQCFTSSNKDCGDYLDLLASYPEKNGFGLENAVNTKHESIVEDMTIVNQLINDKDFDSLKQLFDFCRKAQIKPNIDQFESKLRQYDRVNQLVTNGWPEQRSSWEKKAKENKEIEAIMKENFQKFYPNQEMPKYVFDF